MKIHPSLRSGSALLATLFLVCGGQVWAAALRRELLNRSGRDWSLKLVEGTQAGAGRMTIIDKVTGKPVGILAKAGDSVALPAGAEYVIEFNRTNKDFFWALRVQDSRGEYVEYFAKIPFLNNPAPEFSFKFKHVLAPLNHATDEVILRRIEDAIGTDDGNLIIRQDLISPMAPSEPGRPDGPAIFLPPPPHPGTGVPYVP